jgi:hypothetical protein
MAGKLPDDGKATGLRNFDCNLPSTSLVTRHDYYIPVLVKSKDLGMIFTGVYTGS